MPKGMISNWVKCHDTGEIFVSAKEAAKKYGTTADVIRGCCNGSTQTACGMHWAYTSNVDHERIEKIQIARDLRYDESVISKLKQAKTAGELNRIMKSARLRGKNNGTS